jgi:hypothetical protein
MTDKDSTDWETGQLVRYLMREPNLYIFGGLLKHIICPTVHPHFTDIDLIAIDRRALDDLRDAFEYAFKELPRIGNGPHYFIGKSRRTDKVIQLVLMRSHLHAMQFAVEGPQYDIDRVAFSNGRFYFDVGIGEPAIRDAIKAKRANRVAAPRNLSHFAPHRPMIEQRHKLKLLRKGFTIIDCPSPTTSRKTTQ